MDRRSFLQMLGVVVAAPVVVGRALSSDRPRLVQWRRYRRLPPVTTHLGDGVRPTCRTLERDDHRLDAIRYGMNRTGKSESVMAATRLNYNRAFLEAAEPNLVHRRFGR